MAEQIINQYETPAIQFFRLLVAYHISRKGIKYKYDKFAVGGVESINLEGFEKINYELDKAESIAFNLFYDDKSVDITHPGSILDIKLDGIILAFDDVKRSIQTLKKHGNKINKIQEKEHITIDLIKEVESDISDKFEKMHAAESECINALYSLLPIYADTCLPRTLYANKDLPLPFDLSEIFYYMYPKGNSIEGFLNAGKRFNTPSFYHFAVSAFKDVQKEFAKVDKQDPNYEYKKRLVQNAVDSQKKVEKKLKRL